MTHRRRQWWLRRIALGLAAVSVAAFGAGPAAAKPGEHPQGTRYVTGQGGRQVIPYLSHGILTQAQARVEIASRDGVAGQPRGPLPDGTGHTGPGWIVDRDVALPAGLGAAMVAVGLAAGLAVSGRRSLRLAGR